MSHPVEQIAAALLASRSVLIACHVGPDGDCLGASLALALALRARGIDAAVGSADGVPEPFAALPGADRILTAPPQGTPPETAVAMECSTVDRAGAFAGALLAARTLINIDHHQSNAGYGHLVYWDTTAAAVGEQIERIIRAMEVPVDPAIAQCLLTAIVTDTGAFRFANVTPYTLRKAAELVEAGGSVHEVVERVYETRTPSALRLLGLAMANLQLAAGGRIVWTTITPAMMAAAGASAEETTGIVGMLRQIRGVQIALLFEETPDGIRGSIRSRDGARSHVIAEALGGGGHPGAAGFLVPGPLDAVVARTLDLAAQELSAPRPR